MAENAQPSNGIGWLESSGLPHLLRILGLAIHPPKLGIALAAIILTFVLGGILDWLWTQNGGVGENAIPQFVAARELDQPFEEPAGEEGIFQVWRKHERDCVLGFLGSSIPGSSLASGTPVRSYVEAYSRVGPLRNLAGMGYGVWWMFSHHTIYFIIFAVGGLFIWGWGGGAICRLAAVQFARDEKLTMTQGLGYGRKHLLDGFALAPCIPLAFIILIMILLAIAGAFLRIPVLGDVLGGVTFVLPLIGGIVIALLLVGLVVGGHLFWPAVATEGQDAYDSFSRGLSYAFSKPWKTVLYAVITIVYAAICWLVVQLFTFLSLTVARSVAAWGSSPFGWWARGSEEDPTSKLELLWPLRGPNALFSWPDSSEILWYENISAFFIAVFVLLVAGLMWAFLTSFYFSGSTVIYFLLRRDVDKTDLEDVCIEDDRDTDTDDSSPAAPPSGVPGAGAALPVVDEVVPTPPTAESTEPAEPSTTTNASAPDEPEPGTPSESGDAPEPDATGQPDSPRDLEPSD